MTIDVETNYELLKTKLGDATLLAVTKFQTNEAVIAAYDAGIRNFGENYIDDLEKRRELDLPEATWHFIGGIQRNKLKRIVAAADVIQSIDRIELIKPETTIYIEVNLASDPNRPGCAWEDAPKIIDEARRQGSAVQGLMGIAPETDNHEESRPYFRRLAQMAHDLEVSGLSMGMSNDFEIAIEEGSTMVRIGTALFGTRPRPHAPQ